MEFPSRRRRFFGPSGCGPRSLIRFKVKYGEIYNEISDLLASGHLHMEKILLISGVCCMLAAVIGGGLKAFGMTIPALKSLPRQILLFGLGVTFCAVGLWLGKQKPPTPVQQIPQTTITTGPATSSGVHTTAISGSNNTVNSPSSTGDQRKEK